MPDQRPRILLLSEDQAAVSRMTSALARLGEPISAAGNEAALAIMATAPPDVLIAPWPAPLLLQQVRSLCPTMPVIAIGDLREPGERARALEAGLEDVLGAPCDARELELIVRRSLETARLRQEAGRLREALTHRDDVHLIGLDPAMQAARNALRHAAGTELPVLIVGEEGSGREWAARALHAAGARRHAPFVALDASAFPPALLEEELFGSPGQARPGRLQSARGGTLFLGGIASLTSGLQSRLATVLAGSRQSSGPPGVRFVSSAHEEIESLAHAGAFSPDLHRLAGTITVRLPPLRERPDDIPILASALLDRLCRENRVARRSFSPDALEILTAHPWKGNVRELRHVVECLALQAGAELITRRDLPRSLQGSSPAPAAMAVRLPDGGLQLDRQMAGYERALVLGALERSAGRRKEAATLLGINKDQMKYLCRKHGL